MGNRKPKGKKTHSRRKDPVKELLALVEEAERAGKSRGDVAKQIGCPAPVLSQWLAEDTRPGSAYQDAIEAWSGGRLPRSMWRNKRERELIANVEPLSTDAPKPSEGA